LVGDGCEDGRAEECAIGANGIPAADDVVRALVGLDRPDPLYEARVALHQRLADEGVLREYNDYAHALVEAVREHEANAPDTLWSLARITRRVDSTVLVNGAFDLYAEYQRIEDATARMAQVRVYAAAIVPCVFKALCTSAPILNATPYRARALVAAAIGPYDREPLGVSLIAINGAIGEYTERAVKALAAFDGEYRDMAARTMLAAFAVDQHADDDVVTLRVAVDETNAALALAELADYAARLERQTRHITARLLTEHHARAVTDEPGLVARLVDECAVVGMLVGLAAMDASREAEVNRVLERVVTELAARVYSGDRIRAATLINAFFSSLRFPTAPMRDEIVEAAAVGVEQIDARLARRAKERVQRAAKDKSYSWTSLRDTVVQHVLRAFLEGTAAEKAGAEMITPAVLREVQSQALLRDQPRVFEQCIRMVATRFYPDQPPLLTHPAKLTEQEVARLRERYARREVGSTALAREFVNLAAYYGRSSGKFTYATRPETPSQREVIADMRRLYRSVVNEVSRVQSMQTLDAATYTRLFLARAFDELYRAVPFAESPPEYRTVDTHFANAALAYVPAVTKKRSLVARAFRK
jgi:hypothetical protein